MIARAAGDWVASWADYGPVVRGLLLGLATFVQEDVPTVAAAVGAASGLLTWPSAFVGCFLGIWAGDLLLYGIARRWGRGLLRYRGIRRWVSSEAVVRSEAWFARRGDWLLVTSRFVPGLRLPTYLAAGFLRVPFVRFFGITGVLVF
ncbi:MAG: VTT domain-containing protein, partial [Verrucomicrobiales bacterium]|nr:VTT domain-containing protein [Verrucomicrobiales bacterium]